MIQIEELDINGTKAQGILVSEFGGTGHPNVIMIKCKKGYLMCGYLNLDAAEKFGDRAVLVGGKDFEEVLENRIKGMTSEAEALGITGQMTGLQAAEILNS